MILLLVFTTSQAHLQNGHYFSFTLPAVDSLQTILVIMSDVETSTDSFNNFMLSSDMISQRTGGCLENKDP